MRSFTQHGMMIKMSIIIRFGKLLLKNKLIFLKSNFLTLLALCHTVLVETKDN